MTDGLASKQKCKAGFKDTFVRRVVRIWFWWCIAKQPFSFSGTLGARWRWKWSLLSLDSTESKVFSRWKQTEILSVISPKIHLKNGLWRLQNWPGGKQDVHRQRMKGMWDDVHWMWHCYPPPLLQWLSSKEKWYLLSIIVHRSLTNEKKQNHIKCLPQFKKNNLVWEEVTKVNFEIINQNVGFLVVTTLLEQTWTCT